MAEALIGFWQIIFGAMALGISTALILIILGMVFSGKRSGFYRNTTR